MLADLPLRVAAAALAAADGATANGAGTVDVG